VQTTVKAPIRDQNGKVTGILGIFNDITEWKRAEQTLRESEERHRRLMDAIGRSDIGLLVVDSGYRVRFMNKPLIDAFGDQTGAICYEGIGKTDSSCGYCKLQEVIQSGSTAHYQPVRAIGRTYDVVAVLFQDTDGAMCKLEVLQDITERKHMEDVLRESEVRIRRMADFLERSLQPCGVGFPDGSLGIVNRAFCELTGYSEEELRSIDWVLDLTPEEWREHERTMLAGLEQAGGSVRYEKEYVRKDGARVPIELLVHRIVGETEADVCYYAFVTDITERKRSELDRRRLEAEFQHAQKMEAVGRLAGGVAHDFNNMLGTILGYTEMALLEASPGTPLHNSLREVRKAADRSADFTRQLLAFAQKQTIDPKVLDLNATVEGMLKMLRRLMGEDIDLAWLPGPVLWPVKMDPAQVDHVLANLCVNARDAIAGVGKVTIETGNVRLDKAYCAGHAGFVPGDYVLLAVSDNGCGMGEETQRRLFEPFFTTKELGKGTGLGLATVYGIVKQNNGFINVYSEPGRGTTFKIYLPRHGAGVVEAEAASSADFLRGRGETVLIVEDEPAMLAMGKVMLEELGYTVLGAADPGQALRLAHEHTGDIHLLMTDVVMPRMNGRDLAERFMPGKPGMKCLFMSGYTANVIAHHGVLDEGVHFIQKPFSMKDLGAKVREALGNGELGMRLPPETLSLAFKAP
jgi:PAS domain S-box-containing protein